MASERREPADARPPDVEIGAVATADSIRFEQEPETQVRFRGGSIERAESGSTRENLPEEVEAGKTYRNVRIGWRAAAWVENATIEPEDADVESANSHSGGGRTEGT